MRKPSALPAITAIFLASAASASSGRIVLLKGKAYKTVGGQSVYLKEGDAVDQGMQLTTMPASALKIMLQDKSQLSIGPDSSMRLDGTLASIPAISLVKGQLRAKIEASNRQKIKFILRTKSATMGVRGTEFQTVFNQQNNITAVVTMEGSVAMVKNTNETAAALRSNEAAAQILASDKAVAIPEGRISSAMPALPEPSIPTKISPVQLETLKQTDIMAQSGSASGETRAQQKTESKFFSPVPPGVNAKNFIGAGEGLEKTLATKIGADAVENAAEKADTTQRSAGNRPAPPPEGFYDKESKAFAPPAGGFLDIKTGLYVPPPPGSAFDPNTGVFIPPPAFGKIDPATGGYLPPPGFQIDPTRGFVREGGQADGGKAQGAQTYQGPVMPGPKMPPGATPFFVGGPMMAGLGGPGMPMFGPGFLPPPAPPLNPEEEQPLYPSSNMDCPTCAPPPPPPVFTPPPSSSVNFTVVVQ
ncbi:MAG: hypothetical protein A2583_08555 [Bdellovibrionales bacterium RIFOXYD1_FULL_53_11]|nr:MAG: hypothetical protein A2583_08555 [Bdellovibrionales bacterium RIFOXYD1_FULL_53_11]